MMSAIPPSLHRWFQVHGIIDLILGVPLLLFPQVVLGLLGLPAMEAVTARLVGAALLGIGGASLYCRRKGKESYSVLLKLKIIWSGSALLGLFLSLLGGASTRLGIAVIIFALFFTVWVYYQVRLSR